MHQCPIIRHVRIVRNALPFLLENRNFPVSHTLEELSLKNLGLGFFQTWALSIMMKHKDVHNYIDKPVEFEDEWLDMDGTVDITYTPVRNVITNFRLHYDKPDDI